MKRETRNQLLTVIEIILVFSMFILCWTLGDSWQAFAIAAIGFILMFLSWYDGLLRGMEDDE